jgi:hypothetical protein
MLNVDTQILLYTLLGELTPREEGIVSHQSLGISAIVLWEIAKLHQKGRITLSPEKSGLNRTAKTGSRLADFPRGLSQAVGAGFSKRSRRRADRRHQPRTQRQTANQRWPHSGFAQGSSGLSPR